MASRSPWHPSLQFPRGRAQSAPLVHRISGMSVRISVEQRNFVRTGLLKTSPVPCSTATTPDSSEPPTLRSFFSLALFGEGACGFPRPSVRAWRGHLRFPGGWLRLQEAEPVPHPSSPALEAEAGDSWGWREPVPMLPSLQVVNDQLYSANAGSPHPPPLFFLPTQRVSGRSKCLRGFISCAKPKQNFPGSSASSGGAPCARRIGHARARMSRRRVGPGRRRGRVGRPLGVLGVEEVDI